MSSTWCSSYIRLARFTLACVVGLTVCAPAQTAHFVYAMRTLGGGFSGPNAVAVDTSGNVYIADTGNSIVKEMPAGCGSPSCVETLGGGFLNPKGVAVDGSGVVFVADTGNNRVVKMPAGCASSACVTTLGSGFSGPEGVAVNGGGNVYVADTNNNVVKAVPLACRSSACVTTLGGGFSLPAGIAADQGGNVYVADSAHNAVKKIPAGCGSSICVSVRGGGFANPAGVAIDTSGNIYVADYGNNKAKEIPPACTSAGCVTNIIGGLQNPGGLAVDVTKNVYVADTGNAAVKEVMRKSVNFFSRQVGSKPLAMLAYFQFDSSGAIESPEVFTNQATGLDFNDGNNGSCSTNGVSHVYVPGEWCSVNVLFSPLYAGSRNGNAVLKDGTGRVIAIALLTGQGIAPQVGVAPAVFRTFSTLGFSSVQGITADDSGNFYVSDGGHESVKQIAPGCTTSTCTLKLGGSFVGPNGLAVDGTGNVYVADRTNGGSVTEIPPGCFASSCMVRLGGGFLTPNDVAVDNSGNVYVADTGNHAVKKMPPACVSSTCVTMLGGSFYSPYGVAVDAHGNVYVADYAFTTVWKVPPGCTSSACMTTLGGGFGAPYGVAVDASGTVYVADHAYGSPVKAIPPGCVSSDCVAALGYGFNGESLSLALDSAGNIYLADGSAREILRQTSPTICFYPTAIGSQSALSSMEFTNIGNAKLTIPVPVAGVNPSVPDGFTLRASTTCPQVASTSAPATLAPSSSCTFAISAKPTTTGSYSGSLVLTDNALNAIAPSFATQTIPMVGTGYVAPSMTNPEPNSTLSGASATFTWSSGSFIGGYELKVGDTGVGSSNILNGGLTTATSIAVSNIPTAGKTLYVRLLYQVWDSCAGLNVWKQIDYTYTEQ